MFFRDTGGIPGGNMNVSTAIAEIDQLATRLSHAARRQGGALFLVGEAGIGKTRLAHEALALAREQGFLVLEGCAYALEGRLAYAPILAAFGPFLRRLDSSRQARLVSGLPDLGRLFPDLRLPAAEPLGDAALEKTRLFEAVARLIERLAQETPVLLVVDDLHWADPASIELLHYLARGIADRAVLVLSTHRAEEVDTACGLRSLLTSLRRASLAEEVRIARLGQEAVAELANGLLGSEAPGNLLTLLHARAGDAALRKLGAFADRGTVRHQHPAARRRPGPAADAHARQRLVLLLVQQSAARVDQLDAPGLIRLVEELVGVAGDYFTSITAVAGFAWKAEMPLAAFYHKYLFSRIGGSQKRLLCGLSAVSTVLASHAVACLDWFHPTLGEYSSPCPTSPDPETLARLGLASTERLQAEAQARSALAH